MVCVSDGDFCSAIRWRQETVFKSESAVNTFILKETETGLETR